MLISLNMNVSAFAFIFCILVWSSQSEKPDDIKRVEAGQNVTLTCLCKTSRCGTQWHKDRCRVRWTPTTSPYTCLKEPREECIKPFNWTSCGENYITLYNVQYQHNGTWTCTTGSSRDTHILIVSAPKSVTETPGNTDKTRTTTPHTGSSEVPTVDSVRGDGSEAEVTTSHQPLKPTGSGTASYTFLLPVVAAAVGGLIIITVIVVVVAVKRKQSKKGGVETAPPQKNSDPEVELIDADGQYASIEDTARGKTAVSVEVPAMEPNPMYESYGGNQSENQNQNQNQNQSLNQNQNEADGGDVYSVVNKPDKSSVQEPANVVETGGDVYSVVQKKKQDPPATDGVQSTPDQDITDVYSVVQKPGKTSE